MTHFIAILNKMKVGIFKKGNFNFKKKGTDNIRLTVAFKLTKYLKNLDFKKREDHTRINVRIFIDRQRV